MASATVMHAATNHLVDAVLALILMVGGVTGAQFGARAGQKMSGERLRLLATDPKAAADIPALCEATGHRLVDSDSSGPELVFVIERHR